MTPTMIAPAHDAVTVLPAVSAAELFLAVVPRAPRIPSDAAALLSAAALAFCPAPRAARAARESHLASLIASALAA